MYKVDTSSPVLVTGATGYVAGWVIKKLLEAGVTVHAAVRAPSKTAKHAHLDEIAQNTPGEIKYFKADLLEPGSYAAAMKDCSIVFHTASPFLSNVKDPQKELVDPAKLGTGNVLSEATKTPSVKRVVVTSSCAAIYGDNADLKRTPNGIFTEEVWNTSSTLQHNPYLFSKTEAEKEAWKIAKQQDKWDLITVNPSLVMGPGVTAKATSESFNIIRKIGDGTMKTGVPDWGFGVVDVRDVAHAHMAAAYIAKAQGRYIISGHNTSLPEIAKRLLPRFGKDYAIPRRVLPKFLVWLIAPVMDSSVTRKMIERNVGYKWTADNSKSIRELGMEYRALSETMNDFFEQMVETKQVKPQ